MTRVCIADFRYHNRMSLQNGYLVRRPVAAKNPGANIVADAGDYFPRMGNSLIGIFTGLRYFWNVSDEPILIPPPFSLYMSAVI
jgi:hypothetical protein